MEKIVLKTKVDLGAHAPQKAHDTDAGYDLRCRNGAVIEPHTACAFDTGVHVLIPEGYVGMLKAKSGLNVKSNILTTGVIDAGYTGPIVVNVYNHGDTPYYVASGDKITQLVVLPLPSTSLEFVESLDVVTERGDAGFGSSGK